MCVISIHALVKRATYNLRKRPTWAAISIHALVKRATVLNYIQEIRERNFNPRPREEGDKIAITGLSIMAISIHALVKRATGFLSMML